MSVIAVLGAIDLADNVANAAHYASMGIDTVFPGIRESTEGHGKNIVSEIVHGTMKGLDMASDGIAGVRDVVGGGIHDVLSSVPLVGPLLGGATDAVGFAVDAVGGEASKIAQGVGRSVVDVTNLVGGITTGAGYVDCDDINALDELTEEEEAGMSERELARKKGLVSYGIDKALGGALSVFGLSDSSSEDVVDTGVPEGTQPWVVSAAVAGETGQLSEENLKGLYGGYLAGDYDGQMLANYMAVQSAQGKLPDWDALGQQASENIAYRGYDLDTFINEQQSRLFNTDASSSVAQGAAEKAAESSYNASSVFNGVGAYDSGAQLDSSSELSFV